MKRRILNIMNDTYYITMRSETKYYTSFVGMIRRFNDYYQRSYVYYERDICPCFCL